MKAKVGLKGDGLAWMQNVVKRAEKGTAFLNRVVYPIYQNFQRERWVTQNWGKWPALNPKYARQKLRRFASYPGGGRHMMIATGRLVTSVTGEKKRDHRKIVTNRRLIVGTTVPYAKYPDETREFSEMPPQFWNAVADQYVKYLIQGGA